MSIIVLYVCSWYFNFWSRMCFTYVLIYFYLLLSSWAHLVSKAHLFKPKKNQTSLKPNLSPSPSMTQFLQGLLSHYKAKLQQQPNQLTHHTSYTSHSWIPTLAPTMVIPCQQTTHRASLPGKHSHALSLLLTTGSYDTSPFSHPNLINTRCTLKGKKRQRQRLAFKKTKNEKEMSRSLCEKPCLIPLLPKTH